MGAETLKTPDQAAKEYAKHVIVTDRTSENVGLVKNETFPALKPGDTEYYKVGYAEELARAEHAERSKDPDSKKLGEVAMAMTEEKIRSDMADYVEGNSVVDKGHYKGEAPGEYGARRAADKVMDSFEASQAKKADQRSLEEDPTRIDEEIAKREAEIAALKAKQEQLAA